MGNLCVGDGTTVRSFVVAGVRRPGTAVGSPPPYRNGTTRPQARAGRHPPAGRARRRITRAENGEGEALSCLPFEKSGGVLLSQGRTSQVPSALEGLTSVFGMGTGVTPPLWPPKSVVN